MLEYLAIQNQNDEGYLDNLLESCWYLSRYGENPYHYCVKMTVREIRRGVKVISDFLDAEAKSVKRGR